MIEPRQYRIPPAAWAMVIGLAVTTAGSLPWSLLVTLNLKYCASVPWASVLMAVYLWGFVTYLAGWGPPRSTAGIRQRYLRACALPNSVWRWALVAGGSANVALAAVFVVVSRFGWIHRAKSSIPQVPSWTLAVWLLTGAAVAGIAEECGFRGYMQKMLEDRYRAPVAIAIMSAVFGAIHLTHGFSVALIFDAAWGAVYGALAFLTGSILPSLALHASLDAIEFFLVWRFSGTSPPPIERLDGPAWFALASGAALSGLAFWSFRKLVSERS